MNVIWLNIYCAAGWPNLSWYFAAFWGLSY